MSYKNRPRNGPYDREGVGEVSNDNNFTQPLVPHRPGAPDGPDSYIGGLSAYCVGEAGGGAITMLFLGPLGPLTGLTLVGAPTS